MIRTASKKPVFGAKLSLVKLALAITSIGLVFVAIQKVWAAPDDFITVWNSGDDRTIVIPVFNNSSTASQCGGVTYSQYNFTIDWGDGSPQESYSSAPTNPTHTYANANTEYTITISGYNFRGMTHDSNCTTGLTSTQAHNNAKKLLRVTNWSSSMNWSSMHGMFYNAENLTRVPVGYTFSSVKDMSYMFYNAKSFNYYVILDVPLVETTAYMFYGASSFNHQVNLYSTPKLTNTSHMFHGATAFNSSLGLSTTNVTNMSYMFRNATSFNQPVNFNTTNVTNMSYMFSGATSFNQPVNFDTAKVTNMRYMFNQAGSFNQPVNFNTSLVTDVSYMFYGASAFDQDLSGFSFNSMISNTHVMIYFVSYSGLSVTNYDNLIFKWYSTYQNVSQSSDVIGSHGLKYCAAASQHDALRYSKNWSFNDQQDCGPVTFKTRWTNLPSGTLTINLHGSDNTFRIDWGDGTTPQNPSNVSSISHNYTSAGTREISIITGGGRKFNGWNLNGNARASYLTHVLEWGEDLAFTNMANMFFGATNLNSLPENAPNTANVTNMNTMFYNATSFNQPVNFDTSSVTSMTSMFHGATSFNQPVNFNTAKVTDMSAMFQGATSFDQDVSGFDFSKIAEGKLYNFASYSGLSVGNYDKLLKRWHTQLSSDTHTPRSTGLRYCRAETERNYLKNVKNWVLNDTRDCSFVSKWRVEENDNNKIEFRLNGPSSFTINWGDGTIETLTNVDLLSHQYATSGEYRVAISVDASGQNFVGWQLERNYDFRLLAIEQWGNIAFTNMHMMFQGLVNFNSFPADDPITSNVTDMSYMFQNAHSFNQPINFDTSNVVNMEGMFMGAGSFNQPITFDTSKVTNMLSMFEYARVFNSPINFTDTSKVTNMSRMFRFASAFNRPLNFNTANVTNMRGMFGTNAYEPLTAFNQDLSGFDFSQIDQDGLEGFVSHTSLSTENNDKLLRKWRIQLGEKADHKPESEGLTYCTAEVERNYLKNVKNWTFKDTRDPSCTFVAPNLAPADITLSNSQLDENNAPNFELADINITNDPGDIAGDTNTASLTCAVAGADDANFQITGNKLVLQPATDYETKNSYALCIRATDAGGLTLDKNFTISVRDVNEAPVFNDQAFNVAENLANGTELGQVAASDPDSGQAIAYTIVSGNDLGIFALSADGKLTIANNTNLNYEQHQSVSLQVRVTDNGTPALSDDATITVNITDVNEAPVVTSTPNLTAVKGEQYSYTLTATDADNDDLTLAATVLPNWLSFNAATGVMGGTPGNDQAGNNYNVTLTVNDGTVTVEQSFTIHVNDKNYAPVIANQTFSVAENSTNGTEVGQVAASDPDAGQTLTYTIVSGNNLNIFAISADGKLTVANNSNLNYEAHQNITLRVRVTDNSSPALHAEANITINITDVNEAPSISGTPATSVDQGGNYSFTPTATDPDTTAPNKTLTFEIENKPSWANFNTSTGALTGMPGNEHVGVYENIIIRVTDGGGLAAALPAFNVTVNNINDAPVITNQTFSVAENTANGTLVGQIVASDPDAGQSLSYAIVSGNSLNIFALASDGRLTIANNSSLNYEAHQSVTLRVRVSDNGSPALNAEANITINITDVNEAPSFTSGAAVTLAHNETKTHTLSATDPENNTLTYSANSLPAWISLAGNTLSLTPTLAQIGEHDIVVKVSDDTNETTQTIRVTVREANIAPVISNQTFSIAENSFNGTLVGTLTATDANAGDSLNYEVVGGNQLGIFALSGDGKLTVANNTHLDYEAHQSVTLRVRVSDNGSPALSGEADVTVTITDIDDEAPTITLSSADPITIKEGESFTVPTATCHDNQSDCTMTVTNPVNIDVAGVYYIIYKAVDEAGNQTIAQVLVTVLSKIIPPATNPSLPGAPTQPAPLGQPSTSRPMTLAWPNQSNDETGAPIIENKTASAPFKLKGKQKITLNLNDDYWEPGVECAETTSCIVEIIGKVDTSRAGTYTITYKLADSGYTLTRTVIVHDPEAAQAATDQSQTDNRAGESWWQSAANLAIKLWYIWPIIVAVLWLIVARYRRRRGEVIDDMGFSSRRSRI